MHAGGFVPEGEGAFYPATVLSGLTQAMTILREETFLPYQYFLIFKKAAP